MAKQDKKLTRTLRKHGLRKSVAQDLSKKAASGKMATEDAVSKAADQLRTAAARLEGHVDANRSQAAKKAARTRKRKAAERSASARKGARTRARQRAAH